MGWLKTWRLHQAAKAYAQHLPHRLAHDYGGGGPYTEGQLQTAIRNLRLRPEYAFLAYAAFLDEASYSRLTSPMPREIAQGIFERFLPPMTVASGGWDDARGLAGITREPWPR